MFTSVCFRLILVCVEQRIVSQRKPQFNLASKMRMDQEERLRLMITNRSSSNLVGSIVFPLLLPCARPPTQVTMTELMRDSLVLARNLGMDVFNALNLMQNQEFLQVRCRPWA